MLVFIVVIARENFDSIHFELFNFPGAGCSKAG
jgi:hypothetical protein